MGRAKQGDKSKEEDSKKKPKEEEEEEADDEEEEPEDTPLVKQLKEIDDKYLELQKEYDREVMKLTVRYTDMQRPLLEERKKLLLAVEGGEDNEEAGAGGGSAPSTGTPALSGFWLQALQNHSTVEEVIQEWDEPVLEYLQDVQTGYVDEEDSNKGFTLTFHFAPNPYFSNPELTKEYITEIENPYNGDITVKEIRCSDISWLPGKDVTVERVVKKVKGGGSKKAKQKKEKEEPRPSFFRDFFRNLREGMSLTNDMRLQARALNEEEDEDDGSGSEDSEADEELLEVLFEADHDIGCAISDWIVPFAVRWYTGEAAPDDDDDDDYDDEDDEDDDDDDDDDEESEEEERPARGRGKPPPEKKGHAGKAGKHGNAGGGGGGKDGKKEEECKQQ